MKTNEAPHVLDPEKLKALRALWKAANYLSARQIYLLDNALLHEPLNIKHIKPRLLGHWLSTLNRGACLQCPEGTRRKGVKLAARQQMSADIRVIDESCEHDGDRADLYKLQQSEGKCGYRTCI